MWLEVSTFWALACIILSPTVFIGSIYINRPRVSQRDSPEEIKRRIFYIGISTILWPLFLLYFFNDPSQSHRGPNWYVWLGFQLDASVLLSIILALTINIILYFGVIIQNIVTDGFQKPALDWISIRAFVAAPVYEEIFYRTCLITILISAKFSAFWSILISSMTFGLSHLYHITEKNQYSNPQQHVETTIFQSIFTTVFGFYAGTVFVTTGSSWVCILIHSYCNYMGLPNLSFSDPAHPAHRHKNVIGYGHGVGIFLFFVLFPIFFNSDVHLPWNYLLRKSQQQKMDQDLLELEHVFGFTGQYQSTALYHPFDQNIIIYTIGGLVVIEDVNDKSSQVFLKGHDNDITALSISPCGSIIASGQAGSINLRNNEAPVIMWNYQNKAPITQFGGLVGNVTRCDFSPDSGLLAATSQLGVLMVWNCVDGSCLYSRRYEFPVLSFSWGTVADSGQGLPGAGKHPSYQLITLFYSMVTINFFEFDIASMTYRVTTQQCQLPSTGLNRQYNCSVTDYSKQFVIGGTSSGELCIFNLNNKVFRASLPVSSRGIQAIAELNGDIFIGSGDGKIKRLQGSDTKWNIVAESLLPGQITSLSFSKDKTELLCGTDLGCLFRVLPHDLTNTLHSENPIGAVKDVAFGQRSDMFLVVDSAGVARIYDSSDYTVVFRAGPNNKAEGTACAVAEDGTILTGWADGGIRNYDFQTRQLRWEIPNAHRGKVTALFVNQNYILSGGEDAILRIWSRSTHQLLTQYSDNRKPLVRVFPDLLQPHLIHSCGSDRIINTYDLKLERRVVSHEIGNGSFTDMAQRTDGENELITCGIGCPILFWDCDEANPVQQISYQKQLNSLSMSPDGSLLAAASEDGELVIFSMQSLQVIAQGSGHSSRINSVSWSPDQKQLVTVSDDYSIALWNFFGS